MCFIKKKNKTITDDMVISVCVDLNETFDTVSHIFFWMLLIWTGIRSNFKLT